MKKLSMIAAAVLAFGMAAARAETTPPPMGDATTPPAQPDQTAPPPTAPSPIDLPVPLNNGSIVEPAPVVPMPPGPVETTSVAAAPAPTPWRAPVGVGLLVGGGFQDFSNGTLRNMTGRGGYWNTRVSVGTRQLAGLEVAYVGDARSISGAGLSGSSMLLSNGLEGAFRLNIPLVQGPSLVEPFGFVGLGWAHYQVSGDNPAVSGVATSDDVMTVPYGGGLELAYRGLMLDARFTYRQTYYNNLLGAGGGNLNNWGVGAQIGFEY